MATIKVVVIMKSIKLACESCNFTFGMHICTIYG